LRAALILEESLETIKALGFDVVGASDKLVSLDTVTFEDSHEPDIEEVADGCCDVIVVTLGTLSACGMSDVSLMTEVLDSNDSKFIDGYIGENGKLIKGPAYAPARIDRILISQAIARG
jgi:hypothetical protein